MTRSIARPFATAKLLVQATVTKPTRRAPVALLVASWYALPGYCDRRVWVRGLGWPDHCVTGYSGVRFKIKFSGRQTVGRCPL